jgi:DNA-binding transcriptional MerR regulator
MLKIGEFSKLSNVSVKTLRYYDKRGILKPKMIDKTSGYRFYTSSQLLTIRRIQAWREQGFTLEEIKSLLQENVTPETAVASLEQKKEELQSAIRKAQHQLKEVHLRIQHAKLQADQIAAHSPIIKQSSSFYVAAIREKTSKGNICLLLDELKQYVHSHGENDNQQLIIQWYTESQEEELTDIEVAIPIHKSIPNSDRIVVYTMPKNERVVSLTHDCNPYETSCRAWHQLVDWVNANHLIIDYNRPIREHFLFGDKEVYGTSRKAEISIPIQ